MSGSAGLQVNASGALAAVVAAGVVIAAAVHDRPDPRPAPGMDPSRAVDEQDCSRPVAGSGNLRCR